MLVQSGSGRVYAVIADTPEYELGLMPELTVISTSVFLRLRCRFKARLADVFNPMLVPKTVLVGGIERSKNTLRGTVMFNTGFTVEKVGKGFPAIAASKVYHAAPGFLLGGDGVLQADHRREDFEVDFAQLVESAIGPIYPPKSFSEAPALITSFDLQVFMETAATAPDSPFKVISNAPEPPIAEKLANVTKLKIGGDHEPSVGDISGDNLGGNKEVDKQPGGEEVTLTKVKVFGHEQSQPETTET